MERPCGKVDNRGSSSIRQRIFTQFVVRASCTCVSQSRRLYPSPTKVPNPSMKVGYVAITWHRQGWDQSPRLGSRNDTGILAPALVGCYTSINPPGAPIPRGGIHHCASTTAALAAIPERHHIGSGRKLRTFTSWLFATVFADICVTTGFVDQGVHHLNCAEPK